MKIIFKKLKIEKSKFPNEVGNYVVFLNTETIHGSSWRRIFKGTFKECQNFKKKYLNV